MNRRIKPKLMAIVGAVAVALAAGPVWASGAATVTSPGAGSASVVRTDDDGDAHMAYEVVQDSANSIKYEDATVGLGEDGAIESDLFVIEVENAGDTVRVETKAGQDVAEWISGESDSNVDANGFHVELVSVSGTTYTLRLSSTTDVEEALSHVTFSFYSGLQARRVVRLNPTLG